MGWAALGTWVLTALGGAGLGYMWVRGGGTAQAGGIVRCDSFSTLDSPSAGSWCGSCSSWTEAGSSLGSHFAVLVAVALIGVSMAMSWLLGKPAPAAPTELPAEASFPLPVVVAHGALGATTLLLSLLAALGIGV